MRTLEKRTLHFDLSCFSANNEFTLLAGQGRKYKLHRYAENPSKMEEHRAKNKALALIPEDQLSRISHYVEHAEMDAKRSSMRRVVFPSLNDHPLPEIAMAFIHIPTEYVKRAHQRTIALGKQVQHPLALSTYGLRLEQTELDQPEIHYHAADIKPPGVTAQAIVMQHPELGTADPTIAKYVLNQYVTHGQAFSELIQYIQDNGPGTQDQWYNKSWVLWSENEDGTGPLVPAAVNTDLKFKDGKTPDWPTPPGSVTPGMPTYNLTDEFDPPSVSGTGTGVIGAASRCVQQVLLLTKNDASLNGLLWSRRSGVTQREQTNVPPSTNVRTSVNAAAEDSGAVGFGLKNITSSYGLYLYDDEIAWDINTKTLSFPVKNWPSRYLGAYVQFQKEDGTSIKQSEISAANPKKPNDPFRWQDPLPDIKIVKAIVEPSDTKNFLTWLSSGNAIFGAPVPPLTQKTTLSFLWPDDASKAVVMLGGLGCASGFWDWDSEVDVVGVLGTGIVCYWFGTVVLFFDVYVLNPFLDKLKGDAAIGFYAVCVVIGASALVIGGFLHGTSFGKFILSKLAGIAANVVFGQVAGRLIKAGARQYAKSLAEAAGELVGEISSEEALEEVPVSGWALRVVGIAADLADLAATTMESILSPATYQLEVLRTMDLTVTVGPDPTHGKSGFKPVWPLVSDHYVIQVKYPSGKNSDGGTTYTKSGPMPAQHDQLISVTFSGIPAGGKIDITGNIYSETNWLCGRWDSGWINANPDSDDELSASGNIVELLVPLTPTTTYSQKQTLAYSQQNQHYWQVTKFGLASSLLPDLNMGGSPDAALRATFAANGNALSSAAKISVSSPGLKWTLSDPTSGNSFQIQLQLISSVQIFRIDKATYLSELNAGGETPSDLATVFTTNQQPLPTGTSITVIASGSKWSIGISGQAPLYNLAADGNNINVIDTQYEITVQSTTNATPPLPAVYPLPSGPTGNQLGALQNIIINDSKFELGYAWMASGQNLPLDDGTTPENVPMFTMQSVSTLGQPQDQIIEATRGFSLPSFVAYDQFGLTPLFPIDAKYTKELNNGPVPSDVAQEFSAFGITLPSDAQVAVVTEGKDWTIGTTSQDPLYELRVMTVLQNAQQVTQIGVFTWPIPTMDNFYLDTRDHTKDSPVYYLRGISLDAPGSSTFNYDKTLAWGRISNSGTIQGLAVHPQGYVVAVDFENHKLFTLKLPANALSSDKAPFAMPLSGEGILEGLMKNPTALAITSDGRILILEEGNQRVQAFDVKGNPVPCFAVQPKAPFQIPASFSGDLDNQTISTALIQTWQKKVMPALAAKLILSSPLDQIVAALNNGIVDTYLLSAFVDGAYADQKAVSSDFTVTQTVAGNIWIVTNTKNKAVFDVRVIPDKFTIDHLYVFACFTLNVTVGSKGLNWTINDTTNSMTFQVTKSGSTLSVQQVVSYMPLRDQGVTGISYLDIATETKGYIYVLSVLQSGPTPTFQLDIYNPDGTTLLNQVQSGVNVGKLTVDQYRSMFTLNYNVVLGPGGRTEPGVSEWEPSTPTPAS